VAGPAILAWAVQGCLAWQRDGLGVPPAVEAATEAYRAEMDPLRDFLLECCHIAPDAWVPSKALWERYRDWAKDSGLRWPLTRADFSDRLAARGFVADKGGKGTRVRRGIGLADAGDGDPEVAEVAHLNTDPGNSSTRAWEKENRENTERVRHPRHPPVASADPEVLV
jgi:putative DNA primase/helicase